MTPEPCVATIDTLPATGADPTGWILLGVVAILAGLSSVFLSRRLRERRGALLGAAAVAALALSAAALGPAPAAHAAGSVSYSEGCSLIRVDGVTTSAATSLLPGDGITAITATVRNITDAAVTIALTGSAGSPLGDAATVTALIGDDDAGPVTLGAGDSAQVTLRIALPVDAGDDAQGLSGTTALTVTAAQP